MSIRAEDEQAIQLTIQQGLVLRGAINIAGELIERPGFDVVERFPVTRGQLRPLRNLEKEVRREVQQAEQLGQDSYTQRLDPVEAQAVRDVVGLLEALLQDPGGRAVLVEAGWLVSADQDVDQQELDDLMAIRQMLEPTGERPEGEPIDTDLPGEPPAETKTVPVNVFAEAGRGVVAGVAEEPGDIPPGTGDALDRWARRTFPDLEPPAELLGIGVLLYEPNERVINIRLADEETAEAIDSTRSLDTIITTAAEEVDQGTLPWPGFEEALSSLEDAIRTYSGGGPDVPENEQARLCDDILKDVVAVTKLAVAGTRRLDRDADREGYAADVEDAYTALLSAIETNHCVSRDAQATLDKRFAEVTSTLPAAATGTAPAAQQLLVDLRAVAEPPEDFTDRELDDDERLLGHIDGLRASLEDRLEDAAAMAKRHPEDVEADVRKVLPDSRADCADLLVSLAELAVLAAEVVAAEDGLVQEEQPPLPGQTFGGDRIEPINDARRAVLDKMGFGEGVQVPEVERIPGPGRNCFPGGGLRELRDSIVTIHDPLEEDPDDVETRAFAALSDIRNAFQDPRREGP